MHGANIIHQLGWGLSHKALLFDTELQAINGCGMRDNQHFSGVNLLIGYPISYDQP